MVKVHSRSALVVAIALLASGADWPQFRGPDGNGIGSGAAPVTWSATENVAWKTALPGFGASSPIVVGQRVLLTGYSGYGQDQDEPGNMQNLKHHTFCLNLADGKVLWDRAEKAKQPEKEYRGFLALHGYASGTPVTDGKTVYAFFGASGVYAYTVEGKPLWSANVGSTVHEWGSATSPVLFRNLVVVNASVESQSLVALDKKTGKVAWKLGNIDQSWSTPLLVDLPGGKQELVLSIKNKVLGIDPATGKGLWVCDGVPDYICPSLVAHQGVVYVTAGRKPMSLAVRAGGRGDVTKSHKLWEIKETSKVATPLYHEGHLYWLDNKATAYCIKADSGAVAYKERLDVSGKGDKVYASPVLADGKLYMVTRQDGVVVLAASPTFQKLAHNRLGDESIFNATPAIVDGRLLIRSDRFLYCIGK